jgi:hypothetical protein
MFISKITDPMYCVKACLASGISKEKAYFTSGNPDVYTPNSKFIDCYDRNQEL